MTNGPEPGRRHKRTEGPRSRIVFFCLALAASPGHAQTAAGLPPGRVILRAELPDGGPYVGEMFLLRIRSNIRADINLDEFRQPDLEGFDWQQYGADLAVEDMIGGFRVPGVERTLALFAQRAGHLAIGGFTRHVTIQLSSGERVAADFVSEPLELDVRGHDGVGAAGGWWLPARSVTLSERWEPRPDRIGLDQTARRVVVLEVDGITAERLPPLPPLRVPGLIAFAAPVERETLVTLEGPRVRATYRWDVRPVSDDPARTPAIHIAWFDIAARQMRDAALPEHRVSFVNPLGEVAEAPAPGFSPWSPLAGAAAFAWMFALIYLLAGAPRRGRADDLLPLDG